MFYSNWIPALLATRINAAKILSEEYHEKGGTVILVSHSCCPYIFKPEY